MGELRWAEIAFAGLWLTAIGGWIYWMDTNRRMERKLYFEKEMQKLKNKDKSN